MPAPRIISLLALLLLAAAVPVHAQQAPPPPPSADAPEDEEEAPPSPRSAAPSARDRREAAREREELRREVLEEVRRELERTKEEIRDDVAFVESEAEARNHDAEQLRKLKQSVNLFQVHGYLRFRYDLFNKADLGRGADPAGFKLFPGGRGTPYQGAANMRLRLNPILRVSDDIAVYAQIDALDNVIGGSTPLDSSFFDQQTPQKILGDRVQGLPILVKRVWAEVETPIGQVAFGRKGAHWGEGMLYNDGNCLDCDYGNTFDRLQLTVGPFLGGHLVTAAADALWSGQLTSNLPRPDFYDLGQPENLHNLDDAYRFSLQIARMTPPEDLRRRVANGEWVFNYGLLAAYRTQHSEAPAFVEVGASRNQPDAPLAKIASQFGEFDGYAQVLYRKLRLATELAAIVGKVDNRLGVDPATSEVVAFPGQSLNYLQFAGVLRGQYSFLKQDSLLIGLDGGFASGDAAPGMGARQSRPGSGPNGNTATGDIDGRQYACAPGGCTDDRVSNFRMNPDFRIDQLLWRNLFTRVTDAWFVRAEARFKPGGRPSAGAEKHGFEVSGAFIYSQAVFASSAPGNALPLGFEIDAAVSYTSKDRFFAALIAGFLVPFSGLNNTLTGENASLGQVYRAVLGTTF